MSDTNLLALIPLLRLLCAEHPTNTLPPVIVPLFTYTNILVSTGWVQTSDFKVEKGVRLGKWLEDSVTTNTERETVTAIVYFQTNPIPLSSSRVMFAGDTNSPTRWAPGQPPLPGERSKL